MSDYDYGQYQRPRGCKSDLQLSSSNRKKFLDRGAEMMHDTERNIYYYIAEAKKIGAIFKSK